jgi:hypothetical protein
MADKKPKGWTGESGRHALARKGIKTKRPEVSLTTPRAQRDDPTLRRIEAEQILFRIRRKHISPEQFMDLTGELQTFAKDFPEGSNERRMLEELDWIFVQLHDDPPRLLREKWGFKPKGGTVNG